MGGQGWRPASRVSTAAISVRTVCGSEAFPNSSRHRVPRSRRARRSRSRPPSWVISPRCSGRSPPTARVGGCSTPSTNAGSGRWLVRGHGPGKWPGPRAEPDADVRVGRPCGDAVARAVGSDDHVVDIEVDRRPRRRGGRGGLPVQGRSGRSSAARAGAEVPAPAPSEPVAAPRADIGGRLVVHRRLLSTSGGAACRPNCVPSRNQAAPMALSSCALRFAAIRPHPAGWNSDRTTRCIGLSSTYRRSLMSPW